jgi:hypothetical protein
MKKLEVARVVWKSIKPALQTPPNDRANRFAMACYGTLVVMVFLMIVMQLLMPGALAWLWIGINVPMLGLYTTWFVWSVEGYFYRCDIRKQEATRRQFDEIVRNA